MRIGGSIALLALGLILALAVPGRVGDISLETIGWILTGVGALGLILSLIMMAMARREYPAERVVVTDPRVR